MSDHALIDPRDNLEAACRAHGAGEPLIAPGGTALRTAAPWRVANSLQVLLGQINAMAPNRDKSSDGSIGDAAHAATGSDSDHNPWVGPGIVTARDFTHDPANGFDCDRFTDEMAASRDPRIKYLIFNELILDSRPQFSPWTWQPGVNHTHHTHVSVMSSANLYDDTRLWDLPMFGRGGGGTPPPPAAEVIGPIGAIREHYVGTPGLQAILGNALTGERTCPDGVGKYTHFERGSIYWNPRTGAWAIWGAHRDAWAARGYETSAEGYPCSLEFNNPYGIQVNFEHGWADFVGGTVRTYA